LTSHRYNIIIAIPFYFIYSTADKDVPDVIGFNSSLTNIIVTKSNQHVPLANQRLTKPIQQEPLLTSASSFSLKSYDDVSTKSSRLVNKNTIKNMTRTGNREPLNEENDDETHLSNTEKSVLIVTVSIVIIVIVAAPIVLVMKVSERRRRTTPAEVQRRHRLTDTLRDVMVHAAPGSSTLLPPSRLSNTLAQLKANWNFDEMSSQSSGSSYRTMTMSNEMTTSDTMTSSDEMSWRSRTPYDDAAMTYEGTMSSPPSFPDDTITSRTHLLSVAITEGRVTVRKSRRVKYTPLAESSPITMTSPGDFNPEPSYCVSPISEGTSVTTQLPNRTEDFNDYVPAAVHVTSPPFLTLAQVAALRTGSDVSLSTKIEYLRRQHYV